LPPKKQRLLNLPGQKTLFNFSFSNSKDDTNTDTAIDKSTDHGDDINPGIDPESETQNESQMSESNNKTTETESERYEHRKYRQVSEKLWPWLYLNENKMFCKVCMKAGKKNTMTIGCTTFTTEKCM
jgi:hypothetical protein